MQRRHQLIEKESGRVLDDLKLTFKDAGLTNNALLIMKEPAKGSARPAAREDDEEEKE